MHKRKHTTTFEKYRTTTRTKKKRTSTTLRTAKASLLRANVEQTNLRNLAAQEVAEEYFQAEAEEAVAEV